ncbi:MAG: isopeptide-forming domain-containing fimbrial protein [Butyrivibrio sp.]|nr:isopeptide-forming domain-containing fimbrial protein [Butyrivibrio sp.]
MKGFKKVLTGMLAAAMIMGSSLSVGATTDAPAQSSGATITINPATPEGGSTVDAEKPKVTYAYYEMMYASIDGSAVAYYVTNENLANALAGLKIDNKNIFTVTKASGDNRWNVVPADSKAIEGKGEEIAAQLATIKDLALETGTASDYKINLAVDGYVLIESSLGTKLIVDTYTTDTVNEKNTYPTSDKKQRIDKGEASAAYSADPVNNEIGKTVSYEVAVKIPANVSTKKIVVVDTISKGLTLNTVATVEGATGYSSASWGTDTTNEDGSKTYKIEIPDSVVAANAGKEIKFHYTATINELAVVRTPETNSAHIEYDNYKTVDVTVEAKTYGFDLLKVDMANHDVKLEGVEFTLTNAEGKYYTLGTDNNNNDEARFVTEQKKVVTDANGVISFAGLAEGEYTLTETKTKAGYNLLTAPVKITIAADGTVTAAIGSNAIAVDSYTVTVENGTGATLPSTGGIGTTIFYIIGGLLIVAAVVFFVVRRKGDAE